MTHDEDQSAADFAATLGHPLVLRLRELREELMALREQYREQWTKSRKGYHAAYLAWRNIGEAIREIETKLP